MAEPLPAAHGCAHPAVGLRLLGEHQQDKDDGRQDQYERADAEKDAHVDEGSAKQTRAHLVNAVAEGNPGAPGPAGPHIGVPLAVPPL